MPTWLLKALKVRDGEARRVFALAGYLVLTVSTFITGRIQRDSLFLTEFTKEDLAYMYISVAVMVPLPAYLFARIADRFRRERMLIVTLGVTIALMAVMRVLLETGRAWVYVILYNFVEVYGTFLILQFWTFAGDLFSSREAKRLFPIVSAGSVVAGVVCGIVISALVKAIGTENLLFPQMACLLGAGALITWVARTERARLREVVVRGQARPSGGDKHSFAVSSQAQHVLHSKHLKIIALMTVATFVTVPLVDYQFKVLVKEHFTSATGVVDTDGLSEFMGQFSAATGVIAAVVQLVVTSRLLERFGVVSALLVLPLTLLGGLVAHVASLVSAYVAVVITKGSENAFRYSIYDATMQVLYTPVSSQVRGRAKTFIDGIVKPVSGGLAGAAMVLLVGPLHLPLKSLAVVSAVLVVGWIGLILLIRREYVRELLNTLRRRRLEFSEKSLVINDNQTVDLLRERLRSDDPAAVRDALELCRRVHGHDLTASLEPLFDHPEADLRARALEIVADRQGSADHDRIERLFADPDERVRAAAIRAYCAILGESSVKAVEPQLQSSSASVRGAAVAGLIRYGGLEGILHAADDLKAMLTSDREDVRFACAHVLKEIQIRSFFRPVQRLLGDESIRVRNAAIAAAGEMRVPELVPSLIYMLRKRETARAASFALSFYGEEVIDTLRRVLMQPRENPYLRRAIPRILERIGTKTALDTLLGAIDVSDPDTRQEAARAAGRLRERLGVTVDEPRIRRLIDTELGRHYQLLAMVQDLRGLTRATGRAGEGDLLADALQARQHKSLKGVFRLLGIIHPLKAIETVDANLASSSSVTRSNAVEVLDNLLDGDEKLRLLPIVEDSAETRTSVEERARALDRLLERGAQFYKLEHQAPHERLRQLLTGDEPWLVVCALHEVGELTLGDLLPQVRPHLQATAPIIRETALWAMSRLEPDGLADVCAQLASDPDKSVVRAVRHFRRTLGLASDIGAPIATASAAAKAGDRPLPAGAPQGQSAPSDRAPADA
jgi:HEAT repeat protein/MFS family permease